MYNKLDLFYSFNVMLLSCILVILNVPSSLQEASCRRLVPNDAGVHDNRLTRAMCDRLRDKLVNTPFQLH